MIIKGGWEKLGQDHGGGRVREELDRNGTKLGKSWVAVVRIVVGDGNCGS
ncbi:hypothetical protein HYC85_020984 [Camellia sinensis]|uniref:Uncharacterized protein n=1 Tax=Camellia sinensis TaxID=4442 RepID=A0A7J7GH44_CAMSI|nr:hypothetical protein HYC85_020984 [Camellia sinensis]